MNSNTLTAIENMPFLNTVEWGIFDSPGGATAAASYPADSIPFRSGGDGDDAVDEFTSVTDLTRSLKDHLPSTIIRVFRVPHVPSRK